MTRTAVYDAPCGRYVMAAEDDVLTGLWLEGQKHFPVDLPEPGDGKEDVFILTRSWLDAYFSGRRPESADLPLAPVGSAFAKSVWQLLLTIPYGQTTTYGELAARLATQQGLTHMSARAVGRAVGRNPISIIIPCHRVLGAKSQLTGYAGGLDVKAFLLKLESA